MYDDLFCAAALVSVGSVLTIAIWSGAAELPTAAPPAVIAAQIISAHPKPAERAAMPVHELPRVVVTGHRSRDGDRLAGDLPVAATARSGGR